MLSESNPNFNEVGVNFACENLQVTEAELDRFAFVKVEPRSFELSNFLKPQTNPNPVFLRLNLMWWFYCFVYL